MTILKNISLHLRFWYILHVNKSSYILSDFYGSENYFTFQYMSLFCTLVFLIDKLQYVWKLLNKEESTMFLSVCCYSFHPLKKHSIATQKMSFFFPETLSEIPAIVFFFY